MADAINEDEPEEEEFNMGTDAKENTRPVVIIWSVLHMIALSIYFGYAWTITDFAHEFPLRANPPSPGWFYDRRYDWYSWFISALVLNLTIPWFAMWYTERPKSLFRIDFARILIFVACITILGGWFITGVAWFSANVEIVPQNFFNDPKGCCNYFGSWKILGKFVCGNTIQCNPQPAALVLNSPAIWHLIYAWIILPLFAFTQFVFASAMRSYVLLSGM
jgi:hypothetical protein